MARQGQCPCGLCRHQRFDAEPEHLRQVMVLGVFGVRHQGGGDLPALRVRQALQRGRQVEPHHR